MSSLISYAAYLRHTDIRRPDVVGPGDFQLRQQVRVHRMLGRASTRIRLRRHRLDAHLAHQSLHALAIDLVALGTKLQRQLSAALERPLHVELVEPTHEHEIFRAVRYRLVVQARTANAQQLALPSDRNLRFRIHHGSPLD